MTNTLSSKLRWSRISYIMLSVVLTSAILASVSEQAYAGGMLPWPSEKYTFYQFLAMIFMPLVLGSGLLIIAIIARRSFPIKADN